MSDHIARIRCVQRRGRRRRCRVEKGYRWRVMPGDTITFTLESMPIALPAAYPRLTAFGSIFQPTGYTSVQWFVPPGARATIKFMSTPKRALSCLTAAIQEPRNGPFPIQPPVWPPQLPPVQAPVIRMVTVKDTDVFTLDQWNPRLTIYICGDAYDKIPKDEDGNFKSTWILNYIVECCGGVAGDPGDPPGMMMP